MRRGVVAALAAGLALLAAGCAGSTKPVKLDRPTIVLVHGAFQDSSGWRATAQALEQRGRSVVLIDLPGRPSNPFPPERATLALYRDVVLATVAREAKPVVLVGHSFGGMTISAVAEAAPERIATLVYVGAYLPRNGESLVSLSQRDTASLAGPAFRVDQARSVAWIDPPQRAASFCNDCTPAQAEAVAAGMLEEPLAPPGTPIALSERFAGVKKVYIRTARDRVISPPLQDIMAAGAGPDVRLLGIDTGHLPMVTKPDELAALIDAVR